jgi:hypothetical protein
MDMYKFGHEFVSLASIASPHVVTHADEDKVEERDMWECMIRMDD